MNEGVRVELEDEARVSAVQGGPAKGGHCLQRQIVIGVGEGKLQNVVVVQRFVAKLGFKSGKKCLFSFRKALKLVSPVIVHSSEYKVQLSLWTGLQ